MSLKVFNTNRIKYTEELVSGVEGLPIMKG
jgi:hypothetical protein